MIQKALDILCNSWIWKITNHIIARCELKVMSYYHDTETMVLMKEIIYESRPFLLKPSELLLVYSFAKQQVNIDGDYAEVGVFKGSTAKAICEVKEDKNLYLFDTFEGLPNTHNIDTKFKTKMFQANEEDVWKKLIKYSNVHIYKGFFPETGTPIKDKQFAFVHLDVDIYQSTKDCLDFFYKRMSKNGIIISHDYPWILPWKATF